jgi:hypothetical protein
MASTKAKTAVVIGAVVILALALTAIVGRMVHASRVAAYPALTGTWAGTLQLRQQKLRLAFDIAKTNGSYVAVLDSPDQGVSMPATGLGYDFPSVQITVSPIGGVFAGNFNRESDELSGTWKQGQASFPLTLKRGAPIQMTAALTPDQYAPRAGSDVQGLWKGTLKVNGVDLRLNFKIAEPSAGTLSSALDSVDQGVKDLPATLATYQKPAIQVAFGGIGAEFNGTVNGTEIDGTWKQLGKSWPLTLKRAAADDGSVAESVSYYHAGQDDLPGHWKGTLGMGGAKLRLELNVGKLPDTTLTATMVSIDQGSGEIPATTIAWAKPAVKIEWKAIGGTFEGKLSSGKIAGTWKQGGATSPLVFERVKDQ